MYAKVVHQEETDGKYGRGVHNHITDGSGNVLVLTTWRTHIDDLQLGNIVATILQISRAYLEAVVVSLSTGLRYSKLFATLCDMK